MREAAAPGQDPAPGADAPHETRETLETRERVDVAIIGAGIVGLATALRLLEARPDLKLVVLEGEDRVAAHQSGHNSGVVHAGLYYAPGSQKALLCREGKGLLERYCEAHAIPIAFPGKLVVALDQAELPRLAALRVRGEANGVDGLEEVGPERIREIEPHVAGIRALWSPRTGITDFTVVTRAYAADVVARGGAIELSRPVAAIERRPDGLVLATPRGPVQAAAVIACAGLWSDRVAALTGDATPDSPRIVPFRGDYYTLDAEAAALVNGLVYPVPDPRFPFLGVHLTRRIDGEVWAGPNAVLAFKRAGYRRRDVSLGDLGEALANPGFRRLARRFWRMGLSEMWRDASRGAFTKEVQRFLPAVRGDQLRFGPSGVRAQALARDGSLVDDFDLAGSGRLIHVRNAPSPAATSSLAIGGRLATRALEQFGL
jgi:L-2-hydroxyglutarate oxidase